MYKETLPLIRDIGNMPKPTKGVDELVNFLGLGPNYS